MSRSDLDRGDAGVVEWLTLSEIQARDRAAELTQGHPADLLKPGVLSPQGVAVAGADGYLFIGDGSNRWERQYRGDLTIDPSWLASWRSCFEARQAEANQRGLQLWNFVAPEKQVIYADKRWPQGGVIGDARPLRQLLASLPPSERLIYPQAELTAARAQAPAFSRHNSHWSASGCCAAAAPLLAALGAEVDWSTLRFAYRSLEEPQDLTRHLFDPPPAEPAGWIALAGDLVFDHRPSEPGASFTGSSYGLHNAAASDLRSVIVFGDSYAYDAGLTGVLSAVFTRVTFVWSKAVDWDRVAAEQADLVVWESAERFLTIVSQA